MIRRLWSAIRRAIIGDDHALYYPGMTDEADLDRARKAYAKALAAAEAREAAKDDRGMGEARRPLGAALHGLMKAELGR